MSEFSTLDLDKLRGWIGRTDIAHDEVTPRLARELRATLDGEIETPPAGAPAPLAIHWCLAPPVAATSALGPDGHPARGGFLPPVALPRRMWAGGRLTLKDRLLIGDRVERRSRIDDVAIKQGRTGVLCFVTVSHQLFTPRGLAIEEQQDIVYRPMTAAPVAPAGTRALPAASWRRAATAGPVTLFRYSALTFNGHRIHYDRPYAIAAEAYPGLVVHGPLQASLLLNFAADLRGSAPAGFVFRGLAPLFDFEAFDLCAWESANGLHLSVRTADRSTMDAQASWA